MKYPRYSRILQIVSWFSQEWIFFPYTSWMPRISFTELATRQKRSQLITPLESDSITLNICWLTSQLIKRVALVQILQGRFISSPTLLRSLSLIFRFYHKNFSFLRHTTVSDILRLSIPIQAGDIYQAKWMTSESSARPRISFIFTKTT